MIRQLVLYVRLVTMAVRDWLRGLECIGCGERVEAPPPRNWKYGTIFNGQPAWLCPDCAQGDADAHEQ